MLIQLVYKSPGEPATIYGHLKRLDIDGNIISIQYDDTGIELKLEDVIRLIIFE